MRFLHLSSTKKVSRSRRAQIKVVPLPQASASCPGFLSLLQITIFCTLLITWLQHPLTMRKLKLHAAFQTTLYYSAKEAECNLAERCAEQPELFSSTGFLLHSHCFPRDSSVCRGLIKQEREQVWKETSITISPDNPGQSHPWWRSNGSQFSISFYADN